MNISDLLKLVLQPGTAFIRRLCFTYPPVTFSNFLRTWKSYSSLNIRQFDITCKMTHGFTLMKKYHGIPWYNLPWYNCTIYSGNDQIFGRYPSDDRQEAQRWPLGLLSIAGGRQWILRSSAGHRLVSVRPSTGSLWVQFWNWLFIVTCL